MVDLERFPEGAEFNASTILAPSIVKSCLMANVGAESHPGIRAHSR